MKKEVLKASEERIKDSNKDIKDDDKKKGKIKVERRNEFPMEWWNQKYELVIEERKQTLKNFMKNKTLEEFKEYRKAKIERRKVIRKKRRDNFMEFVQNINKNI